MEEFCGVFLKEEQISLCLRRRYPPQTCVEFFVWNFFHTNFSTQTIWMKKFVWIYLCGFKSTHLNPHKLFHAPAVCGFWCVGKIPHKLFYALGENWVLFNKACHAQKSTNHIYATQITGANQPNDPIQLSDEQQSLMDVFQHA